MPVLGINHINLELSAAQLPAVKAFYENVLGLQPGFRTPSRRDGAWLYAGSDPIIHLSVSEEALNAQDKTHFNHVAFTCNGLRDVVKHLDLLEVDYRTEERALPAGVMTQIFVHDPLGVKIELNFNDETLG